MNERLHADVTVIFDTLCAVFPMVIHNDYFKVKGVDYEALCNNFHDNEIISVLNTRINGDNEDSEMDYNAWVGFLGIASHKQGKTLMVGMVDSDHLPLGQLNITFSTTGFVNIHARLADDELSVTLDHVPFEAASIPELWDKLKNSLTAYLR